MRFSFNLPDDKYDAIINAVADRNDYQDIQIDRDGTPIPNPISREQFVKKLVREQFVSIYAEAIALQAAIVARNNARNGVGGDV